MTFVHLTMASNSYAHSYLCKNAKSMYSVQPMYTVHRSVMQLSPSLTLKQNCHIALKIPINRHMDKRQDSDILSLLLFCCE